MKTKIAVASVALIVAGYAYGQQTVSMLAGLPNQDASPVFTLPEGKEAMFPTLHITLATGPMGESVTALQSLSGLEIFNTVQPLIGNGINPFREETAVWGANVALPGQSVNFTAASQIWIIASTSPLASLATSDYLAMLASPVWVSAAPDALTKPTITMNTSRVIDGSGTLYVGQLGSIQLVAVPEPSHFALGLGVLGLGFVLWRRRR